MLSHVSCTGEMCMQAMLHYSVLLQQQSGQWCNLVTGCRLLLVLRDHVSLVPLIEQAEMGQPAMLWSSIDTCLSHSAYQWPSTDLTISCQSLSSLCSLQFSLARPIQWKPLKFHYAFTTIDHKSSDLSSRLLQSPLLAVLPLLHPSTMACLQHCPPLPAAARDAGISIYVPA